MSKIALLESHQTTQRSNISIRFIDSPDSNCDSCVKLRLNLPCIRLLMPQLGTQAEFRMSYIMTFTLLMTGHCGTNYAQ